MSYSFVRRLGAAGLTRVSVSGSGGTYHVRIGSGADVESARVWWERGILRCDCGRRACAHIESLRACGFLDEAPADLRFEAA